MMDANQEAAEQAEADRLFSEISALPDFDPSKAEKVVAGMALAGEMSMGVSLRLLLRFLQCQAD